jgi:hypothetical protein
MYLRIQFRLNQTAHSKVTQKLSFNNNSKTIYSILTKFAPGMMFFLLIPKISVKYL